MNARMLSLMSKLKMELQTPCLLVVDLVEHAYTTDELDSMLKAVPPFGVVIVKQASRSVSEDLDMANWDDYVGCFDFMDQYHDENVMVVARGLKNTEYAKRHHELYS